MHSVWRTLAFGVVVALGVVLVVADIVSVSAQASDPRVGSWKLNVAKSTYSPVRHPKWHAENRGSRSGEKVTADGINAAGTPTMTRYTANYDGKDYPLAGVPNADTVSLKRIDARTTERTDKKDGKVVQTLTRVVSQDGKTMTVTSKGTNAQVRP